MSLPQQVHELRDLQRMPQRLHRFRLRQRDFQQSLRASANTVILFEQREHARLAGSCIRHRSSHDVRQPRRDSFDQTELLFQRSTVHFRDLRLRIKRQRLQMAVEFFEGL